MSRTYKRDKIGRFATKQYVPKRGVNKPVTGKPMAGYPTRVVEGQEIPYDPSTGRVPREMMASRFLARSKHPKKDYTKRSKTVLENPTPEDLAEWWNDPTVCDVAGIDDEDVLFEMQKLKDPKAQERIAVLAKNPDDQARIRQDLEGSFSSKELKKMSAYQRDAPGLTIDARARDDELLGSCDFRTENRPGNMIMVSKDAVNDGETTVHEGVHLLRHAEGRSENKDRSGRTNTARGAFNFLRTRGWKKVTVEEVETERETKKRCRKN